MSAKTFDGCFGRRTGRLHVAPNEPAGPPAEARTNRSTLSASRTEVGFDGFLVIQQVEIDCHLRWEQQGLVAEKFRAKEMLALLLAEAGRELAMGEQADILEPAKIGL